MKIRGPRAVLGRTLVMNDDFGQRLAGDTFHYALLVQVIVLRERAFFTLSGRYSIEQSLHPFENYELSAVWQLSSKDFWGRSPIQALP